MVKTPLQILALIFNVSLLLATLLLSVLSYLAIHPLPDLRVELLSHFMFQLWLASLGLGMLTLLMPKSRLKIVQIIMVLLVIGWNTSFLAPYFKPVPVDKPDDYAKLKVVSANVWGVNEKYGEMNDYLAAVKPDVIVFSEYNNDWQTGLEAYPALKAYPYKFIPAYGDDAIYSKKPLQNMTVYAVNPGKRRLVSGELMIHKTPVHVFLCHPKPPLKEDWTVLLKHYYQKLGKEVMEANGPVLIAGDMNSAPWYPSFRELLTENNLRDTEYGFGVQTSWPSWLPAVARVPIDHVLVSDKDFVVLKRELGPNLGSDHLPVYVELGLKI